MRAKFVCDFSASDAFPVEGDVDSAAVVEVGGCGERSSSEKAGELFFSAVSTSTCNGGAARDGVTLTKSISPACFEERA